MPDDSPGTAGGRAHHLTVYVGSLRLDLLLGDVHSLKGKRSIVRPVTAELRRRFEVSVGETGHHDLHRRVELGVALVSADSGHCRDVLAACERWVAARPELELLSARTRLWDDEDEYERATPWSTPRGPVSWQTGFTRWWPKPWRSGSRTHDWGSSP